MGFLLLLLFLPLLLLLLLFRSFVCLFVCLFIRSVWFWFWFWFRFRFRFRLWFVCWLFGWLFGWSVGWLFGWSVGRPVGRSAGPGFLHCARAYRLSLSLSLSLFSPGLPCLPLFLPLFFSSNILIVVGIQFSLFALGLLNGAACQACAAALQFAEEPLGCVLLVLVFPRRLGWHWVVSLSLEAKCRM